MPSPVFDRDTHAEMVVRALHGLGVCSATVNTRHDIVLLPDGMVAAQTKMEAGTPEGTRKISGSAYKMTRLRSYHHGTMLLDSRLEDVRSYLRSPARGWLKARGVDSVRSPVANVGVGTEVFVDAVVREFGRMYLRGEKKMDVLDKAMDKQKNDPEPGEMGIGVCYVGEEALEVGQIRKGVEELKVQVLSFPSNPITQTAKEVLEVYSHRNGSTVRHLNSHCRSRLPRVGGVLRLIARARHSHPKTWTYH